MSASIIISSPILASDGKTLTATLSGGTGTGYAPASGVTGLTVKQGTNALLQASATISGTTITVTLAAYRLGADTITLDVSASSNLTDSGANTATAATATAITNNSTVSGSATTANITDAAVLWWGDKTDTFVFSRNARIPVGADSGPAFSASGTQVEMLMAFNTSGTLSFSTDGGARVAQSVTTNTAWMWVPISTGVSDAAHRYNGTLTGSIPCFDRSNPCIRVIGASPTVTRTSGYEGTPTLANNAPVKRNDGTSVSVTSGHNTNAIQLGWADAACRVRGRGSSLKVWGFWGQTNFTIKEVGGSDTLVTNPQNDSDYKGTYGPRTFATGMDDVTEREYEITAVYQQNVVPGSTLLFQFLFVSSTGGGVSVTAATDFPANAIVGFGDSQTQALISADSRIGYVSKVAAGRGWRATNRGISGTSMRNFGGSSAFNYSTSSGQARAVADLPSSILANAVFMADLYGTNDMHTLANMGTTPTGAASAVTPTNYQAACEAVYAAACTAKSTLVILACGILECSDANNSANATYGVASTSNQNRLALNAAKRAACVTARAAYPSARIVYVDLDGVILVTSGTHGAATTDSLDGLHLNGSGHTKLTTRLNQAYDASGGITITGGASSGPVGVASPSFTATLPASGSFYGTESVTLSDGGNGGTFTPSVGSPFTSSGTVTPTAASTSFTFTYTPASGGAKTITYTNGQGWTNPSASAFTANADVTAPATPVGLSATPGNAQVVLNWTANSEGDLVDYRVYRATSSGGSYTLIATVTAPTNTYTDTGRTNGTTYYYKITARDGVPNESAQTSFVSATPAFPTLNAPTIAFIYSTATAIRITRTAPATGGDSSYTYNLHRSTVSGFTPSGGNLIASGAATPYDDSASLTVGVVYYYKLVVIDGQTSIATSTQVSGGLPYDGTGGGSRSVTLSTGVFLRA